jgi:hypothetical protein
MRESTDLAASTMDAYSDSVRSLTRTFHQVATHWTLLLGAHGRLRSFEESSGTVVRPQPQGQSF